MRCWHKEKKFISCKTLCQQKMWFGIFITSIFRRVVLVWRLRLIVRAALATCFLAQVQQTGTQRQQAKNKIAVTIVEPMATSIIIIRENRSAGNVINRFSQIAFCLGAIFTKSNYTKIKLPLIDSFFVAMSMVSSRRSCLSKLVVWKSH